MRIIIRINTLFLASLGGNYRCCLPIFGLFKQLYPDLVCSRTDICIEGYPRSGNTYFVEAFEHWNPRSKVAHHSHHACNVKRAIKDGLPAVIRLRKPESAAASVIVWDGLLLHGVPLMAYAAFYSTLWRYRENLPVLNFDYAVNHPEVCINRRFGTGFSAPKISEDDDHAIRQILHELDARHKRGPLNSSLPNDEKAVTKRKVKEDLRQNPLFTTAWKWWERFHQLAIEETAIWTAEPT